MARVVLPARGAPAQPRVTHAPAAARRGLDGFRFFGYSLGHVAIFGRHRPGRTDVWQHFPEAKEHIPDNAGRAAQGNPQADPPRGGAIPVVTHDPREVREAGAADA
ncbi:MAG TPA: hypothetical protein VHN13_04725 [Candidatus Tectomicrobia bacterium]|nr:hypothetical protein [Candidatus Tectomicrobia bacterium]